MSHSRIILLGASSDIDAHLTEYYLWCGAEVVGTYRSRSSRVAELEVAGAPPAPREALGGRSFSLVHDEWRDHRQQPDLDLQQSFGKSSAMGVGIELHAHGLCRIGSHQLRRCSAQPADHLHHRRQRPVRPGRLLKFAFYCRNRCRYPRAAYIDANLGLHSILLSLCGAKVDAYEADPAHHAKRQRNLALNKITTCTAHQVALSEKGNTTSSHLAGAKANPYGELERFDVVVQDIRAIAERVDLFKIDAEGHEAVLLSALSVDAWNRVDAFVEIGTPENARAVFDRFAGTGINIFAQKRGWARVESIDDVPVSYKEGGVFVSAKPVMPW